MTCLVLLGSTRPDVAANPDAGWFTIAAAAGGSVFGASYGPLSVALAGVTAFAAGAGRTPCFISGVAAYAVHRSSEDRSMTEFYSDCHRRLQDAHQSRALADRLEDIIVHTAFTDDDVAFITARDFFFVSTVDPDGQPTVSYKGGAPGFVAVRDNRLVFPCYDGNGMFLSAGNIDATAKVGLLFIDLETPRRLRVQGVARLAAAEGDTAPGALLMVHVTPVQIFMNCPRYIHRYVRLETSKNVPDTDGAAPLAHWKRLEIVHDALPPGDRAAVREAGFMSFDEVQAKTAAGEG
jgi:hypothetical protein